MTKKTIGELLAADDEVATLKPRRARKPEVAKAATAPDARVTIVLEENDNIPPTGQFFSINGKTFMLRPGEPADVPRAIVDVLEQAVQEVPQIDPTTRQVIGYRKRLRFPYRVVQLAAA